MGYDTPCNVNEPKTLCQGKRLGIKDYMLSGSIYMKLKKKFKTIMAESTLMAESTSIPAPYCIGAQRNFWVE